MTTKELNEFEKLENSVYKSMNLLQSYQEADNINDHLPVCSVAVNDNRVVVTIDNLFCKIVNGKPAVTVFRRDGQLETSIRLDRQFDQDNYEKIFTNGQMGTNLTGFVFGDCDWLSMTFAIPGKFIVEKIYTIHSAGVLQVVCDYKLRSEAEKQQQYKVVEQYDAASKSSKKTEHDHYNRLFDRWDELFNWDKFGDMTRDDYNNTHDYWLNRFNKQYNTKPSQSDSMWKLSTKTTNAPEAGSNNRQSQLEQSLKALDEVFNMTRTLK